MARTKPEIIYENTVPAIFVQRNNRFTAEVMVGDEQKTVHIKNTGRLEELLVPKAKVTLQKSENPERKTEYHPMEIKEKYRSYGSSSHAESPSFKATLLTIAAIAAVGLLVVIFLAVHPVHDVGSLLLLLMLCCTAFVLTAR